MLGEILQDMEIPYFSSDFAHECLHLLANLVYHDYYSGICLMVIFYFPFSFYVP